MIPEWRKAGWAPAGAGHCKCPTCGEKVSTNAFARANHVQQCKLHQRNARIKRCPRMIGGVHILALTETRCSCGYERGMK